MSQLRQRRYAPPHVVGGGDWGWGQQRRPSYGYPPAEQPVHLSQRLLGKQFACLIYPQIDADYADFSL
ncbi:MAG: hypothetical protein R3D55_05195 [Chloroflexota bacterium]